jgi:hypothetical protein
MIAYFPCTNNYSLHRTPSKKTVFNESTTSGIIEPEAMSIGLIKIKVIKAKIIKEKITEVKVVEVKVVKVKVIKAKIKKIPGIMLNCKRLPGT